jgi:uncharacterized integral membrane protein
VRSIASDRGWPTIARLIGTLVVLLLFALFIVDNAQTVRLHFVVFDVDTHLSWALVIAGVLGVVVGLLAPYVKRLR